MCLPDVELVHQVALSVPQWKRNILSRLLAAGPTSTPAPDLADGQRWTRRRAGATWTWWRGCWRPGPTSTLPPNMADGRRWTRRRAGVTWTWWRDCWWLRPTSD